MSSLSTVTVSLPCDFLHIPLHKVLASLSSLANSMLFLCVLVCGCTTTLVWRCAVVADVVDIEVVGVEVVGAEILEAEIMERLLLYLDVFPVAFLCFVCVKTVTAVCVSFC